MNPYLTGSFGLHLAAAVLAARFIAAPSAPAAKVYNIDFVGPAAAVLSRGPEPEAAPPGPAKTEAAPSAAVKPPPQTDFDEFGRRKKKRAFALPKPSLLRLARDAKPDAAPAVSPEKPAAASGAPASATAGKGAPGESGMGLEMSNFPYPWYISRVRAGLWTQWSARMPAEAGETVVVFTLLQSGALTDLRTEVSSGDAAFDLTALSAVQDAAPYPPLPPGFTEPFLKIHLTLKSQ